MGNRALSHDSIFIPEAGQDPARPVRVFSQENVCDRIKALQVSVSWTVSRGVCVILHPIVCDFCLSLGHIESRFEGIAQLSQDATNTTPGACLALSDSLGGCRAVTPSQLVVAALLFPLSTTHEGAGDVS